MNEIGVQVSGVGAGTRSGSRVTKAAVLALGAAVLAGAAAGVPLAGAQADSGASSWSDARWASDETLNGPIGAVGTIEVDWRAGTDLIEQGSDSDLRLELPAELIPVTGTGAGAKAVRLVDTAGLVSGTGVWSTEAGASAPVFLVDLDDEAAAAAVEAGETLEGTLELDVTWSPEAVAALDPGEQVVTLQGPGLGGPTGTTELKAVYAVEAAPSEGTTTTTPSRVRVPAQVAQAGDALEIDIDERVEIDTTAGESEDTDGATVKPKPKPKPKPTDKPKPTGPGDSDQSGKPEKEKVTREAGGREKVKSVPAGPTGAVHMPTIG